MGVKLIIVIGNAENGVAFLCRSTGLKNVKSSVPLTLKNTVNVMKNRRFVGVCCFLKVV